MWLFDESFKDFTTSNSSSYVLEPLIVVLMNPFSKEVVLPDTQVSFQFGLEFKAEQLTTNFQAEVLFCFMVFEGTSKQAILPDVQDPLGRAL